MAGSGFADYTNTHKYSNLVSVPLYKATEESLKEYGRIVRNFNSEQVWISTWPAQGSRPICPGTGNCGSLVSGAFRLRWEGEYLKAVNDSVEGNHLRPVYGRLPGDILPTNRTHVLVREANYHPDGGQVFYPKSKSPFVALLALPGDEVKPQDFVAFYFDGSFGLQIKANIWHQPMYPVADEAEFDGKQRAVHACVAVDVMDEFETYLKVPLKPEYISQWAS